jgi:DNA-binding MarR family transcriptional regulator
VSTRRSAGGSLEELRRYRNTRLYRALGRVARVYNRVLVEGLHTRGFEDFTVAFAQILSNLDTQGTRIGVLAERSGVTRQAAGQLVAEIERAGYVERSKAKDDARAVVVRFTPRGKKMLEAVFELVDSIEGDFAQSLAKGEFDRLRRSLAELADRVDRQGSFGEADED